MSTPTVEKNPPLSLDADEETNKAYFLRVGKNGKTYMVDDAFVEASKLLSNAFGNGEDDDNSRSNPLILNKEFILPGCLMNIIEYVNSKSTVPVPPKPIQINESIEKLLGTDYPFFEQFIVLGVEEMTKELEKLWHSSNYMGLPELYDKCSAVAAYFETKKRVAEAK